MFILRLLMADACGDEIVEVCGDDGGVTDVEICSIINPMTLISFENYNIKWHGKVVSAMLFGPALTKGAAYKLEGIETSHQQ